jgi:hypothetical protein
LGFYTSTGQFDVLPLESQNNIGWSYLIGLHFGRIQPKAHLPQTKTVKNDIADAVNALKLFLQNFIGIHR